jgi:hypothetical protein
MSKDKLFLNSPEQTKSTDFERFTDEELLLEIRRRGRTMRIVTEHITPGYQMRFGEAPPDEYIWPRLGRDIGYQIGERIAAKLLKIPGQRTEMGFFSPQFGEIHKDKKFILPLNFIVEP